MARRLSSMTIGLLSVSAYLPVAAGAEARMGPYVAQPPRPVSVTDSVQLRYPIKFAGQPEPYVSTSPDGSRYVVFLQKGNLEAGGIDVEVVTGSTASVKAAASYRIAGRLFTTAKVQEDHGTLPPTFPGANRIIWLADGARIAFLWTNGEEPTQVATLNLDTSEFKTLTKSPTVVRAFSITPDGKRVAYAPSPARDKHFMERHLTNGFAVSSLDTLELPTILRGQADLEHLIKYPAYFIADAPSYEPREVWRSPIAASACPMGCTMAISPDGNKIAIPDFPAGSIHSSWAQYTDPGLEKSIDIDLNLKLTGDTGNWTRQARLIDTGIGSSGPLWDVPVPGGEAVAYVWSPDGTRALVGPTLLPLGSDRESERSAIVEVEVQSGRATPLPVADGALPHRWLPDGTVEVRGSDGQLVSFIKDPAGWRMVSRRRPGVRIEMRENLNVPPQLVAIDRKTGKRTLIKDLNPELGNAVKLARVENITWTDERGRTARGRLHYPIGYVPGRRYPLIVQTNGHVEDTEFSLVGNGRDFGTAYAAQPSAGRGFLVVQVMDSAPGLDFADHAGSAMAYYESAVRHLIDEGLADPDRLGIIGYSRSGWWVEHMLVKSAIRFGAAVVADNMEVSYGQYILHGDFRVEADKDIGAAPFGDGLLTWLERSPGFNLDKICTPLRLENSQSGLVGLTGLWETYSMLTQLGRAVELYTLPESDTGIHPLQRPNQRFASQQATVDWFDFWINGHEDPDEGKRDQYDRWRKLRETHGSSDCADSFGQRSH